MTPSTSGKLGKRSSGFWKSLFRFTLFRFFAATVFLGFFQHAWIAVFMNAEFSARTLRNLSFGLSYDIMNAGMLALLLVPLAFLPQRFFRVLATAVFSLACVLYYVDLQYVYAFGTHIPFSHVEYLTELDQFGSSALGAVRDYRFFLFCVMLPAGFWFFTNNTEGKTGFWRKTLRLSVFAVLMVLLSGFFGNYANSNFTKNINNPLVSSGLFYFAATVKEGTLQTYTEPKEEMLFLAENLRGASGLGGTSPNYPLVRKVRHQTCAEGKTNLFGEALCSLKFKDGKPNILFILLESFRAIDTGVLGNGPGLTPDFDRLVDEGILFERFFANGYQTRHALVATLCSLMPNYGMAILHLYTNRQYDCLPAVLKRQGYQTVFLQGGSLEFDNMDLFLPKAGFSKTIGERDFDPEDEYLGWGYSDEAAFDKLLETLDAETQPFFATMLSITNHHPFDVPEAFRQGGQSFAEKYYESMNYTSFQIRRFLQKAKTKDWYADTLIFVLADTSNNQPSKHHPRNFDKTEKADGHDEKHKDFLRYRYQVPLLVLGGKITDAFRFGEFSGQIDLAPTVADILELEGYTHWAGRSLLDGSEKKRAFANRPGGYFALMEEELFLIAYWQNDAFNFVFNGYPNPEIRLQAKKLGLAWIKTQQWLLQEDKIWMDTFQPRLGEAP